MVSSQLDLPCSCKELWPKRCFCWLFERTYNVWTCIFWLRHFMDLRAKEELQGIVFSLKWALVGKKVMLGQSLIDFSYRNPNLPFLTFDELGAFLEESWSILDQMMYNTSKCLSKILKFDFIWITVNFWPSTIDFHAFEQLTEQTCCVGH